MECRKKLRKLAILVSLIICAIGYCFAEDSNICIFPRNREIEQYLTTYFVSSDRIKSCNLDINNELLRTGDKRLLEYISKSSQADILIFPIIEEISSFNYLTLYVFKDGTFNKIYESLDNKQKTFGNDILLGIYSLFRDDRCGLIKLEGFSAGTSVYVDGQPVSFLDNCLLLSEGSHTLDFRSLGYTSEQKVVDVVPDEVSSLTIKLQQPIYNDITIDSNPSATVFLDGKEIGTTPFVIKEYSIPLILRFRADGYSDQVVSITQPTKKYSLTLKPTQMAEVELFKKRQNKFYGAFTRTLLLFGGMAATRASNRFNPRGQKVVNYVFYGAIGLSLVDLGIDLYRYFNGIKNISP